jgi:Cu+-exporting ATPase
VKLIGMTLKNISGIKEKQFNVDKRELCLKIDATTSGEAITKAIREDAEYEATVASEEDEEEHPVVPVISQEVEVCPIQTTEPEKQVSKDTNSIAVLTIDGMHCTSCSALIEKSLRHVSGVEEANVNFASEKARVKFDPKKVTIAELEKAVLDAGYVGKILGENKVSEVEKRKKELKFWFYKFFIGGLLSLPMVAFMVYDFVPRLPLEKILMPYSAIISLILATPVLFIIGKEFFSGAWSALKMKTFNMFSLISIGTLVAYIYSLYSYFIYFNETGSIIGLNGMKIPNIYFEVAAFLVTFVALGKYFEAKAKGKTSEAIEKLM